MKRLASTFVLLAAAACARSAQPGGNASPRSAVDELLAADRAFSAASMRTDAISGLSAMFASDVVMPLPGGRFADGAPAAIDALRANPANANARLEWTPVRGGISADGQQGFTFGYMTQRREGDATQSFKYLAYWVKRREGWRVAAYKRRPRPEGRVSLAALAPALPSRMVAPNTSRTAAFGESLAEAERSFSRDAQRIGLGPAFAQWGTANAMNLGGPADTTFVIGAAAIARLVADGEPDSGSSVSWGPDRVIVASSGDLGVTIGTIRINSPPMDGNSPTTFAFFTVWRRSSPSAPWRYIAE